MLENDAKGDWTELQMPQSGLDKVGDTTAERERWRENVKLYEEGMFV